MMGKSWKQAWNNTLWLIHWVNCIAKQKSLEPENVFVCLWFYVPLDSFSLIWRRRSPLSVKGFKCWPIVGTLIQVLSVPNPLWRGSSVHNVDNGYLWEPVPLAPVVDRTLYNWATAVVLDNCTTLSQLHFLNNKRRPFSEQQNPEVDESLMLNCVILSCTWLLCCLTMYLTIQNNFMLVFRISSFYQVKGQYL